MKDISLTFGDLTTIKDALRLQRNKYVKRYDKAQIVHLEALVEKIDEYAHRLYNSKKYDIKMR